MEHEIIGHSNKAIKIMKSHDKSFWEKTKEIFIEILIIVFAVTFAAFIERTREHSREKSEAKAFISGLKGDLVNEIDQLEQNRKSMDDTRKKYSAILELKSSQADSLKNSNTTFSIADYNTLVINGRYDGFKSSGKIQTIENDSLRNDILQYYQQDIPLLEFTENTFNNNQKRFIDMFAGNSNDKDNEPIDIDRLLTSNRGKLILTLSIGYSKSVTNSYDNALKDAKKIKAEIDREYP
jgi:uncharacterized protein DUF6090